MTTPPITASVSPPVEIPPCPERPTFYVGMWAYYTRPRGWTWRKTQLSESHDKIAKTVAFETDPRYCVHQLVSSPAVVTIPGSSPLPGPSVAELQEAVKVLAQGWTKYGDHDLSKSVIARDAVHAAIENARDDKLREEPHFAPPGNFGYGAYIDPLTGRPYSRGGASESVQRATYRRPVPTDP